MYRRVSLKYQLVTAGRSKEIMETMFREFQEPSLQDKIKRTVKFWLSMLKNPQQVSWVMKRYRDYLRGSGKAYKQLYELSGRLSTLFKDAKEANIVSLHRLKFPENASAQEIFDSLETEFKRGFEASRGRLVEDDEEAEPVVEFPDGWQWQLLSYDYCENDDEGMAMQHCGNAGGHPDDQILSLREPVKKAGRKFWKPHLTFVLNDGLLTQMKGFANSKPKKIYHPYIVKLLESDFVESVLGGGYGAGENFSLNDLDADTLQELLEKKPGLDFGSYRLLEGLSREQIDFLRDKVSQYFEDEEVEYDDKAEVFVIGSVGPRDLGKNEFVRSFQMAAWRAFDPYIDMAEELLEKVLNEVKPSTKAVLQDEYKVDNEKFLPLKLVRELMKKRESKLLAALNSGLRLDVLVKSIRDWVDAQGNYRLGAGEVGGATQIEVILPLEKAIEYYQTMESGHLRIRPFRYTGYSIPDDFLNIEAVADRLDESYQAISFR